VAEGRMRSLAATTSATTSEIIRNHGETDG
jgi:hypothetical protein